MESEGPKQLTKERVDLHAHANGNESDYRILDQARQKGVVAIALGKRGGGILKNHDKLCQYGKKVNVEVLTQMEFNTEVDRDLGRADLIALGFDHNHPAILGWVRDRKSWNTQAAVKQLEFLKNRGFTFDNLNKNNRDLLNAILVGDEPERTWSFSKIVSTSAGNRIALDNLKESNPLLWQSLENKFRDKYKDEGMLKAKIAWSVLLAPGTEGYIPRPPGPYAKEYIDTVHKAGGIVIYSPEGKYDNEKWERLKTSGIDGIMLWHGSTLKSPNGVPLREFVPNVRQLGLLVLGGSDYDPNKDDWQIGTGQGNMSISTRRFEELKKRLELYRTTKN